jgi:non-heme chloroperoxidase
MAGWLGILTGEIMKKYTITGGGGIKLHVVEDGNPDGRPLLFIHGWSSSYLAWVNQFHSSLTGGFRIVAMDNRGHGLSDKPRDVYGDSKLWADDIDSVITELNLDRPIISGWSYGGIAICDYLRVYGDSKLGGVHFVGAASKLGTEAANEVIGKKYFANAVRSMSEKVDECIAGIQAYLRQMRSIEPELHEFLFILGYNAIVPPFVRKQLFARAIENDDVLQNLTVPALITHGDKDEIVLPLAGEQLAALIPDAKLSVYENVGHSPFAENAKRFNQELLQFALYA